MPDSSSFLKGCKLFLGKIIILILCCFIVFPCQVIAAPYGGQVISGSAAIAQSGTVTNINQSTNKAIINWQGFSIASNETVNFNQPSVYSMNIHPASGCVQLDIGNKPRVAQPQNPTIQVRVLHGPLSWSSSRITFRCRPCLSCQVWS